MDRRILPWGVVATVLVSVVWGTSGWAKPSLIRRLSGKTPAPAVDPIQWQPDLKSAHRVAAKSGRPILIVVGGPGCVYCKKLEGETLSDPSVASYINTAFVPVHLDWVADNRAAQVLEVKSLP